MYPFDSIVAEHIQISKPFFEVSKMVDEDVKVSCDTRSIISSNEQLSHLLGMCSPPFFRNGDVTCCQGKKDSKLFPDGTYLLLHFYF